MTISKIQGPKRGYTGGSSISMSMDSTPTNGNVLIAVIGSGHVGSPYVTVNSITQTGVSWSKQVQKNHYWGENNEDYENVEIWLGVITSGASRNISISLSHSCDGMSAIAYIAEYSGIQTSGYLDQTATDAGYTPISGDPGQTHTGTTAQTTKADELWIGGIACGCMNIYLNQTNPTNGFSLTTSNVNTESVAYLEKIVSAVGQASTNTTITYADWVGCIATFKAELMKNLDETLTLSDALLNETSYHRLLNETLTLIDSVTKEKEYIYVRKVVHILLKKFGVKIKDLKDEEARIKYKAVR